MTAILIMFYVVVAVCAVAVIRLPDKNFMFIPCVIMLALGVVAITGLAVGWAKSQKRKV